jgi:hypothetical protein
MQLRVGHRIGCEPSARHLHGVRNENEVTMRASILSPTLLRSAYDSDR